MADTPGKGCSRSMRHTHISTIRARLHRLWPLVGGGQHPAVLEYFLADMRRLVR